MRKLFGRTEAGSERLGIVEELELLARRARFLALILPVLLLSGFGAGRLVSDALRLPDDTPAYESSLDPAARIHISKLDNALHRARLTGDSTAEYVQLYQTEVAPIEHVLRRRGVPLAVARRVAWPLVEQAHENGIDPATVVSVVLIESAGKPDATSFVGARGLMQIMPLWIGYWRGCGRNLYDIEANLCNGTRILAWYMTRHGGDERRALLGYNGCVRGSNTPNCRHYPDKIANLRHQVRREIAAARAENVRVTSVLTETDDD
ncbi:MAG: lytic transglycosylase domain-containing protein [Longimicrobiales bacterium]